ncbi:hypothetical protein GJ496_008718 [Pomphorhynchus laevis]|nr:hypothetical protein GJ496_008718 [Pomphorhynchus laevis]
MMKAECMEVSVETIKETRKDVQIQQIRKFLISELPRRRNIVYLAFISRKYELSYESRILMWIQRIIIPGRLRFQALKVMHEGNPGISVMKHLAVITYGGRPWTEISKYILASAINAKHTDHE